MVVEAADGTHTFDLVVAGTGYQHDPATRPELARLARHAALWRDVHEPPADLRHDALGASPYLDHGYRLTEREPGTAPWVRDVHVFSAAASTSFGRPVGDVPSLRTGVPRLVDAIVTDLALADRQRPRPAAAATVDEYRTRYEHAVRRPAGERTQVPVG